MFSPEVGGVHPEDPFLAYDRGVPKTVLLSEKRLIRLSFWDTLWEQFGLSDQSALIDASPLKETPLKPVQTLNHTTKKLNQANRYENEMV